MSMSERSSIVRKVAWRVDRLRGSLGWTATSGIIVLTVLGIDCQVSEAPAAATYATALALGALLLARAVAANRGASKSSKSLLKLKPVRVRPSDLVDRNLR
jgi:hypothetical protein